MDAAAHPDSSAKVAGRRALVTGASSGIGEATARLLANEGYRVALLARRSGELERVVATLPRRADHCAIACDLRDAAASRAAIAKVASEFGALDLLVNNAGIGYRARVEELDDALLRDLFETNVLSLLRMCRDALPLLRKGERAVVVNVSSIVGRRGVPGQAAYCASKAAVSSIGEALRVEWARERIAVCTLEPGLTLTNIFDAQPNPSGLPHPSLAGADSADDVARRVLALDRDPQPEVSLRKKWRLLAVLSVLAPRLADKLLVRNMGGGWEVPRR